MSPAPLAPLSFQEVPVNSVGGGGAGTWQNRESQGKQGWEWEWALWGLCIYAPHFIWGGGAVCSAHVRACACRQMCVRVACELQLQCEQQQREFELGALSFCP